MIRLRKAVIMIIYDNLKSAKQQWPEINGIIVNVKLTLTLLILTYHLKLIELFSTNKTRFFIQDNRLMTHLKVQTLSLIQFKEVRYKYIYPSIFFLNFFLFYFCCKV